MNELTENLMLLLINHMNNPYTDLGGWERRSQPSTSMKSPLAEFRRMLGYAPPESLESLLTEDDLSMLSGMRISVVQGSFDAE